MDDWPPKYTIRESHRAKHTRLSISANKGLEVVIPTGFKINKIPKLLLNHKNWIKKHLTKIPKITEPIFSNKIILTAINETWNINEIMITSKLDDREYVLNKWLQLKGRQHLIPWFNRLSIQTDLKYNKISIRGQKTKWGSCSIQNNINLNYKLLFLEPDLVDYIIIHELCHTKYHSHRAEFWGLVAKFQPNHRDLRKRLRENKY